MSTVAGLCTDHLEMAGRDIPADIRRAVRQRDRFGCVVCGLPIYDYEHFVPYSDCGVHEVDNIYLACVRHHRAKNKTISSEFIQRWRSKPFNTIQDRTTTEVLQFSSGEYEIRMANSCLFVPEAKGFASAVTIHGESLLGFELTEDGILALSLRLLDENDNLLLRVDRNEVDVSTVHSWDFTWEGKSIVVRQGAGEVAIRVSFDVDRRLVAVESAKIRRQGEFVIVSPSVVRVRGNSLQECEAFGSDILLCVGDVPHGQTCANVVR